MIEGFFSTAAFACVAFIFATFLFLAKIYRRCPSNQILVVFGRVGQKRSVQCYHGGGTFVWPLIQASAYLDLTPRSIHIPLKGALSQQNIRINVPSTFTVAVGITPEVMNNAAVRMLGLSVSEIESMANEIIIGQLRLTVASLKIEEINQDRERFLDAIKNNIEPELHKIGLTLINVNITDITDESEYIDSIGKKAAATAVNQAKIDVAEQEKSGEIGKAIADRERRIQVAMHHAKAVEGENLAKAEMAATNAILNEKEAEAQRRSEVAKQIAEVSIQKAKAEAEVSRLQASEIVPQEISKQKIEIEASAQAQKRILEAKGEADALLAMRQAEAEGLKQVLDAKAKGFSELMQACGEDTSTMLLIEKLEEIVRLQTEAIRNIKIDKITVWDSGQSDDGKRGTTTSNFLSNMVKSVPALHDVAEMAGVELPGYLGKLKGNTSVEVES
ncbi:MAG: flotillin family protein [Chlamydiia bacterium]|nr:flotillin family protein [Chlamydiia bacterium]MCP5508895.1 flotillin family protein [Chlamydiales bacterium]HPE84713.1 SPFH domain-containing protein [Chlamydiales bacterium]